MDQAAVVVDRLVTAIRQADYNGVDIKALADQLADGDLSEHEVAQLRQQVRNFIKERDRAVVRERLSLMSGNLAIRLEEAEAEAAANPDSSTLRTLAKQAKIDLETMKRRIADLDGQE